MNIEMCHECNEETGNGGVWDGSLIYEGNPYCENCYVPTIVKICEDSLYKITRLQAEVKRLTDENAKLKREVDMAEKQSLDFYVEKENAAERQLKLISDQVQKNELLEAERDAMREQLRWRHWPEAPTKNGEYLFDHEEIPEKEVVSWIDGEWSVHNTYKTNHRWLPIAQDKGSDV